LNSFPAAARVIALAGVLVALAGGPAAQATDAGMVQAAEGLERVALMTVNAHIMIETDGTVSQVDIDTKITPQLAESLQRTLLKWRYQPVVVAGQARRAKVGVSLALAAEQEGENYKVRLDGVDYPDVLNPSAVLADGEAEPISAGRMQPPGYPPSLQVRGVMGRVLLAIRVTPEGKAGEVMIVQSLLYDIKRPTTLTRRTVVDFQHVAMNVARNWTFKVPAGSARRVEDMTVTVPVVFSMGYYDLDAPGQWVPVLRLPRQTIPWLPASQTRSGLGVASSGGGVSQFGAGPKLMQDVSGMALQ
jgi:TonB family protein